MMKREEIEDIKSDDYCDESDGCDKESAQCDDTDFEPRRL